MSDDLHRRDWGNNMKGGIMNGLLSALFSVFFAVPALAAPCGDGYVLNPGNDVDGIAMATCEKIWCRDLETGNTMGAGDSASVGYVATNYPNELCVGRDCVMCFGDRRWCKGEKVGIWNPEYGGYTRDGADSAAYESYLRGGCFAWKLEKPTCADGEMAILKDGEWFCATSSVGVSNTLKSSTRRGGGTGRRIF